MRNCVLILTILTAVVFAACKGSAVRSPEIIFNATLLNGKVPASDTVYVGDTVQFYMILQPYYDRLTYFRAEFDHSYFKDSLFSDDDYKKLCDQSSSKRAESYYVFNDLGNGTALYLDPGKLIAKKSPDSESKSVAVKFYLKSSADLKDEYNPYYVKLSFKILDKPKEKE